jgi:site-specific DNA-cytosine methylase
VNVDRRLREQEQASADQDEIASGDRAAQDIKKRRRQPDDPADAKQKQDAHPHRGQESHPPGPALLSPRKLARKNRNEDDVVDAEHDLKQRQRDERNQSGNSEECVHSDGSPLGLSCMLVWSCRT